MVASDSGFSRGGLRLVVHVDRVLQLLTFEDLNEALCVGFSGSGGYAVLPTK